MAKFKVYEQVDIALTEYQYPVVICHNGLNNAAMLHSLVASQQVLIVTNQVVAPLYLDYLQSAFASLQCDVVILPDGEHNKNQQNLELVYNSLIQKKHHRDTTVIALGGGVIGDLAGFAASTYQRGVRFVQIPTTLLAQVDASVGGKTAINHEVAKNIIGSFYQPYAVIIDLNTLNSLPQREFRAGIAEMIKYGLLAGGDFLQLLSKALQEGLTADSSHLPHLIAQCCRIKAEYVENDEKEFGRRALLNLGHTFAHALEAYTKYQRWLHGEAVAIGLYCAAILSYKMGLAEESIIEQVECLLQYANLPHKIPRTIDLGLLRNLMNLDKKIKNNCLRFIVIQKPGNCYLNDTVTEDCLLDTLIAAVEGE